MHIVLFSPAWPLEKSHNGIVTYCHWMKQGLESHGHRVSIVCGHLEASLPEDDVHLVKQSLSERFHQRWLSYSRKTGNPVYDYSRTIAQSILRVHRADPIDIIEMEESFGWFDDVRRLTNIPLVVKLHGPAFLSFVDEESETTEGREKIIREGIALKRSAAIVSPCRSTLAETLAKYNLSPKIAEHVVNPLALEPSTPLWRLADCDQKTFLFVGRFDKRKGADVVLNAFFLALKACPDLKLIFVGPDRGLRCANGSIASIDQFLDSVFGPKLRDRVEYRGPMSNREIAVLRTKALLTIIGSRWENPGYTLLEAMFQGCPVLSSNAGGCRETVEDGTTGRLARSEDVADFAAKMSELVNNPASAALLGEAGRRVLLSRYSPQQVALQSVDLYRRVLERF